MKVEPSSTDLSGASTFISVSSRNTPKDTMSDSYSIPHPTLSIETGIQPQESISSTSAENASSSTFVYSQSRQNQSNDSQTVVAGSLSSVLWENQDTLAFSVTVNGHEVARREPDGFINCTKLLNLANITRGVRDGILKAEGVNRVVVIKGSRALRGIWINPTRSRELAERYSITSLLYPLFESLETIIAQLVSPQHLVATQSVLVSGRILIEKRLEGSKGKFTPSLINLKNLLDSIELAASETQLQANLPQDFSTSTATSFGPSHTISPQIDTTSRAVSLPSIAAKYSFGTLDLSTSALPDIDFTTPRLPFDLSSFDSKSRRNTCPHIDYTPSATPKLSPTSPLSPPSLAIDLPIVFPEGFDPSSIRRSLDSNFMTSTDTGGALVGIESRSGKRRFSDVSAALTLTRLFHSEVPILPKVEVETKEEVKEEAKVETKSEKCTKDIARKLKKAKIVKEENFRASKIITQPFESSIDTFASHSILLAFYSQPGASYNGALPADTNRPLPFPPLPPAKRYQSPVQPDQYFSPLPPVISTIMSTNLPPSLPYYNNGNTQPYRSDNLGFAPNYRLSNNSSFAPMDSIPLQHNTTQFPSHHLQNQAPPLPLWNYQATYTQTYSAQNPPSPSLSQTQPIVPVRNTYPPVAYQDHYPLPPPQYNYQHQPQYSSYPPPTTQAYSHPPLRARHPLPPPPLYQSQLQSQNSSPPYHSTIDERYQYQNQIRRNQEVVEQHQRQPGAERLRNNPGSRGDSIGDVFGVEGKNEKRL